ncbi:MAG: ABC transporter substrate-binding protein [Candidatus Brachytrichaceae bacterium NZ_4S206]
MNKRPYFFKLNELNTRDIAMAHRITRRRFIGAGGAAIGAALVGCAAPPSATTPTPVPTPTAENALSVVALDEFAGLAVLSLGIKPAQVFITFDYASAEAVFDFAGVQTAPAAASGVNLEAIAALKPAIIMGVSIPTTVEAKEKLDVIAPTTVIEYTASWQDQLKTTGATVGRMEAADLLIKRLDAAVSALKSDLASAGAAGKTVSVIGALSNDMFALSRTGTVGSILGQVGLKRPAAQDMATEATDPFITISAERLNDHDADLIFLLSGGQYTTDTLTASPIWKTLKAVLANQVVNVVAELWLSSNAFGVDWIVRDLRAALLGTDEVATDADVVSRWLAFTSAQS